jgi:cysteinyl-tRNA synthetase
MVKFWLHTGFLNVNGEKMSKSLNNFITIRELLEDYAAETFRFFVLSTHYRSPIDFSKDSLHQSEKSLERIRKYYDSLDVEVSENIESDYEVLANHKKEFFDSMDDDFNTPKAIAAIFGLINDSKNELDDLSDEDKMAIKAFLDDAAHIFGVSFELEEVNAGSDDLLNLISEVRSELRANKQYDLSDKIRDNLQSLGYEIND